MLGMRLALVALLVGAVTGIGTAQEKKEEKKADIKKEDLVGTWAAKKDAGSMEVTFSKDGKVKIEGKAGDNTFMIEGTYELKGDQLTVTMKQGDQERKREMTVKTLTDKKLVTEEKGSKNTDEFTKKK